MAINKKAQRAASTVRPDPAPFQALVDQGKAALDVVLDAYEVVLCQWSANGGTSDSGDVIQDRPVVDPNEPPGLDALLIHRWRERMFADE